MPIQFLDVGGVKKILFVPGVGGSKQVAMNPACCCGKCYCFANNPEFYPCAYALADNEFFSEWSNRLLAGWQVTITGTCTHRPVKDAFGTTICTPASCTCPSGTFVLGCNECLVREIREVVCEDYNNWYVTRVQLVIGGGSPPPCNSNVIILRAEVATVTEIISKADTLPAEVGTGWYTLPTRNPCITNVPSGSLRVVTWKFNDPGHLVYLSDLGGSCTMDCIIQGCLSKFPDPLTVVTNTNSLAGANYGGCDTSGLSFSAAAVA